ncbi:MAG: hypothetical protein ACRKFN_12805 [Desulfitobacterium sp.]
MINLIIYGTGKLGQMLYYLLKGSPQYNVVCFTADKEYCGMDSFLSLPLIPFDVIDQKYPSSRYKMLTVLGGLGGAGLREEMFKRAKKKGYEHINYIHPSVIIEGNIEMGENNIVFPYSILGFSGKMGNNNILREKVYLGHEFEMGDHNFIGVGCNIGGESKIGNLSYMAMGTTLTNNIVIQDQTFVGIGSLVLKDTEKNSKYYGRPAKKI